MTTFSLDYSYSYKLADLLSCVLSLSMSVRPNVKSVFETGSVAADTMSAGNLLQL